jgi:N-methylhydantoinase A/oxoprolinase/acetone carboxylase beta subunit
MLRALDLRLGIDVGGTNTDAVLLDREGGLLAKAKAATTPDVTTGIVNALDRVLAATAESRSRVHHVMFGTTHATNAVLQRRKLRRVAVVRVGGPATFSIRPLFGWPDDLRDAVSAGETIVDGGSEFDGREIMPFDGEALRRFLSSLAGDVDGVAVTSVFASVSAEHELRAAEIVRSELGSEIEISLSHEIGTVGLLERENATVLNAALTGVVHEVTSALEAALASRELDALVFFAQNDGTLMAQEQAIRFPVLTIGSGPANSIRGAAYLTGIRDAIVVDVGGTSTDVGVLANGFPRESSAPVEIGGIRTNFRMPDLVSLALGGGSVIRAADGGRVSVGPESVGFELERRALVFGGDTATLTDAAVAAGRAQIGRSSGVVAGNGLLTSALEWADAELADAIDRVKLSRAARPLIVVGGGSVLVPEELPGASEVHRPDHFDVANAIGAAIAMVSGQVDRIFDLGPGGRQAMLDEARGLAREHAIRAGANPHGVEIVELEELPLAYLNNPAVRVRAKAAGPLESG